MSKFINSLVKTLNNQTLNSFEVIFVNDGSTDDSLEKLTTLLDASITKFDFIVISKENGGLSDARNFGIQRANYEFIAFLDADDTLSNQFYEELLNGMLLHNSTVGISSHIEIIEESRITTQYTKECITIESNPSALWKYTWSACTKVYAKKLFDEIEFDKGLYHEDLAVIPFLLAKANKVFVSNSAFYHYYRHPESILGTLSVKKELDTLKALELMQTRLKGEGFWLEANFIAFKMLSTSFLPITKSKYTYSDYNEIYQKTSAFLSELDISVSELIEFNKRNYSSKVLTAYFLFFKYFPKISINLITICRKYLGRGQ
jgi:glycosyltransferase involved in cell wall biosynthesis